MLHAKIGGSTVARAMRCPGSVALVASLPRAPSSGAADRGTMLHHFIARMIAENVKAEALVGQMHLGIKLTAFEARTALLPAHYAYRQFLSHIRQVRLEQWVELERDVGGTADVLGVSRHFGYVADFKFGAGRVHPARNPQLMFYAACALESGVFPRSVKSVRAAIIQPGAWRVLERTKFSRVDLTRFAAGVRRAAKLAFGAEPPLKPGPVQCEYCPAKRVCPALGRQPSTLAAGLAHLKLRV